MGVNPLNIALSGLRVAQAQINVTSNNIANVSTDGYTRKTLDQYTTVVGGQASGVASGQVERNVDQLLLRDYRSQISLTSELATKQEYLDQVQALHGAPDQEISVTANIGKLQDAFSQLSNLPEDTFALRNVFDKATALAKQFNDFSGSLTQMRNDAQSEMKQSVSQINSLTKQIADLNSSIAVNKALGRTSPDLEDQRDVAIRDLSKQIDLSYYTDDSGSIVVMTKNGQLLADKQQVVLNFNPTSLGATSYYPLTAASLRLGDASSGTDITADPQLGGNLGALVDIRDKTLPTYQAQIDELAQKMSTRFDAEGLRLFTTQTGTVPANTPTAYAGYASTMVVNPSIVADQTLIRKGTSVGSTVQDGSAEVLRKVLQFTFGSTQYEEIDSTANISSTVTPLFTTLGVTAQARINGTTNVQALGSLDSSPYINPPTENTFTIQVGAAAPTTITIAAGDTAATLVSSINATYPGMASIGAGGQLSLKATSSITIGPATLGADGLQELGLTAGTTAAVNPSFQVGAGNNALTTIEILPTDTSVQLLAKLNAVAGITATLTPSGTLKIAPTNGGDITTIDGQSAPLAALGAVEVNIPQVAFNSSNLGASGSINGRISDTLTLADYSTQMVSLQSQDAENVDTSMKTEDNYRSTLENEYMDSTGVNLDEEMSNLIAIQNAYTASARAITTVQSMLNELMDTFR